MAGFPPKTKNSNVNIPDTDATGATKGVYSKGNGGIPASLKIKNAGVKPPSRPAKDFDENVLKVTSDADKTQSYF